MKKKLFQILLGIIIFFLLIFLIRLFSGPEDDRICENGNWIKHGNPSANKPSKKCPRILNKVKLLELYEKK